MDFSKYIELDDLTLEDCVNLNAHGYAIIIENDRIINLVKEK